MDSFISLSALAAETTEAFDGTVILASPSSEQTGGGDENPLVDADSKGSGYYPTYCVVA
jgi:hypothetical protein